MYIICGLGNPGKEYVTTRHNMGFLAIDELAKKLGVDVSTLKFKALVGEARIGSEKIILVKPQTYMNLSGEALRPIADYYKVPAENILVIYDDVDIAPGNLRIRPFGSAGSHNGMKSVIFQLQTDRFPRVRIGIGDHGIIPLDKYVLSKPTDEEIPLVADAIVRAAAAAEDFVRIGISDTMNKYNTKHTDAKDN